MIIRAVGRRRSAKSRASRIRPRGAIQKPRIGRKPSRPPTSRRTPEAPAPSSRKACADGPPNPPRGGRCRSALSRRRCRMRALGVAGRAVHVVVLCHGEAVGGVVTPGPSGGGSNGPSPSCSIPAASGQAFGQALAGPAARPWPRQAAAVAAIRSWSCSRLVALAIGAVTPGRAISQASATWAGVARCSAATSSSAARMRRPRSSRYLLMPEPRGLWPRSASERYLPVRKPRASEK